MKAGSWSSLFGQVLQHVSILIFCVIFPARFVYRLETGWRDGDPIERWPVALILGASSSRKGPRTKLVKHCVLPQHPQKYSRCPPKTTTIVYGSGMTQRMSQFPPDPQKQNSCFAQKPYHLAMDDITNSRSKA